MDAIGRLRLFHLLHLSKPRRDRALYRTICQGGIRTILELGVGGCDRAVWMVRLAAAQNEGVRINYTALDPFEAAPGHGVSLRTFYQRLRPTGAKIRLIPGEPLATLPQMANHLGRFDLVVISAQSLAAQTPRAWFYLPRLLVPDSLVLLEESGDSAYRPMPPSEIASLASGWLRRAA